MDQIKELLVAAVGAEAMYIVRGLQGKLRIRLAQTTCLVALAQAFGHSRPQNADGSLVDAGASWPLRGAKLKQRLVDAEVTLKQVFSEVPDFGSVVPALLASGIDTLPEKCYLRPGVPVNPMLAKPTKGVGEVLDRFTDIEFTCELKYDGERAQIHLLPDGPSSFFCLHSLFFCLLTYSFVCFHLSFSGLFARREGTVRVFSRNLENNTQKYPDIVSMIPTAVKPGVQSFIIDCEAVAYDRVKGTLLPFQTLSTRKKVSVQEEDVQVAVVVQVRPCFCSLPSTVQLSLRNAHTTHSPLPPPPLPCSAAPTPAGVRHAVPQRGVPTQVDARGAARETPRIV